MGLDIVLGSRGQTKEEIAALMAADYSDSKVGYIRYSYGDGNFFDWARVHLDGRDPSWIFGYAEDKLQMVDASELAGNKTAFFPDWNACRERVTEALNLAKTIGHSLFLVPLDKPPSDPREFPA